MGFFEGFEKSAGHPGMGAELTRWALRGARNPGLFGSLGPSYASSGAVGGALVGGAAGAGIDSDNRIRGALVGAGLGGLGGYAGGKGIQHLVRDPERIAKLESRLKKQMRPFQRNRHK